MGVNGKQYDYSSDTCMLCECVDGSCVEDRVLPWTQDTLLQTLDLLVNEDDCEDAGYTWHDHDDYCFEPNAWGLWDVIIRDFFILNRQGEFVAKINLTYNNPDPNDNCGNNYQLIKDLLIQTR